MHKVTIRMRQGKPTIKVEGVKGEQCAEITADLEKDLGAVVSKTKTTEYYEAPQSQTRNAEH